MQRQQEREGGRGRERERERERERVGADLIGEASHDIHRVEIERFQLFRSVRREVDHFFLGPPKFIESVPLTPFGTKRTF